MQFKTLTSIRAISERYPKECGKILQLLLAISLDPKRGGFRVTNRLTEGVDLELTGHQKRYAMEVKTTEGSHVCLQDKDVVGLRAKAANDGYIPALAALKIQRSSNWVVANAARLEPGSYTPERLALDSISSIESLTLEHFDYTVAELCNSVLHAPGNAPLEILAEVLLRESQQA